MNELVKAEVDRWKQLCTPYEPNNQEGNGMEFYDKTMKDPFETPYLRMRLDSEGDTPDWDEFALDLDDVVENGDVLNTYDVLLKTIDGAKKRGKELKTFQTYGIHLYKQYNIKRKQTEWTLYLLVKVSFG